MVFLLIYLTSLHTLFLDDGRITALVSRQIWLPAALLIVAIWLYQPSPMLILVAIIAIRQFVRAARKIDPNSPSYKKYQDIEPTVRFSYAILYFGMAIVLALMLKTVN